MVDKVCIRDYLNQFSNQRVIYKPNPGNGGDSVIASATYQLLGDCGVDYKIYRKGDDTNKAIVMYGGGGNLVELYTNARTFLQAHHQQVDKLILLPHTVEGNEDLLKELGSNTTIFCREPHSFEHVKKNSTKCEVLLADDLALSLDVNRIKSLSRVPPISVRSLYSIPQLILNDMLLKNALAQFKGENVFNCFRVDPESATESLPEKNLDLSEILRYKSYPRFVCDWITRSFILTLDQFENINTDRLHVGIVSGLLGKTTRLYPGNYYKNKAVFEFSIRPCLKTVGFN